MQVAHHGEPVAKAMAFYHQDGLTAAWQQAMKFAGEGGRLATTPDIVAARLESTPGDVPWETYFTTLSAEYFGYTRRGARVIIVAHGVGPMSTLDGIQQAYSWQYKDKTRTRRGGRITEREFWDLESGKYGAVSVIDFEKYLTRYEYPFIQTLRSCDALIDPVLMARLGWRAEEYVRAHTAHARRWHREQSCINPENRYKTPKAEYDAYLNRRREAHAELGDGSSSPWIIRLEDDMNCSYRYYVLERGYAMAHLLATSGLCHQHDEHGEHLTNDVGLHGWSDGVRLVGIKAGGETKAGISSGPNAYELLRRHWRDLLVPMKHPETVGFRALVPIGKQWFTQYPKQGECMDTWEPEYVVTSKEEIGKPALFRTTVGGYYGFFQFGTNEVKSIAPPGANAYFFVGEPQIESNSGDPMHQICMTQFYRVTVDATKRLMRSDRLAHDYDMMMGLLAKEGEAD